MTYGNLQKLSDTHCQVAALIAQGVRRAEIAALVNLTPEYINNLTHDDLFNAYLQEMVEFSQKQIEVMFTGTVEAIGDGLRSGDDDVRLKAARLQLEVTNRVGRGDRPSPTAEDSVNRLARLAENLAKLVQTQRGETLEGTVIEVQQGQLPPPSENRAVPISQPGQG